MLAIGVGGAEKPDAGVWTFDEKCFKQLPPEAKQADPTLVAVRLEPLASGQFVTLRGLKKSVSMLPARATVCSTPAAVAAASRPSLCGLA